MWVPLLGSWSLDWLVWHGGEGSRFCAPDVRVRGPGQRGERRVPTRGRASPIQPSLAIREWWNSNHVRGTALEGSQNNGPLGLNIKYTVFRNCKIVPHDPSPRYCLLKSKKERLESALLPRMDPNMAAKENFDYSHVEKPIRDFETLDDEKAEAGQATSVPTILPKTDSKGLVLVPQPSDDDQDPLVSIPLPPSPGMRVMQALILICYLSRTGPYTPRSWFWSSSASLHLHQLARPWPIRRDSSYRRCSTTRRLLRSRTV